MFFSAEEDRSGAFFLPHSSQAKCICYDIEQRDKWPPFFKQICLESEGSNMIDLKLWVGFYKFFDNIKDIMALFAKLRWRA